MQWTKAFSTSTLALMLALPGVAIAGHGGGGGGDVDTTKLEQIPDGEWLTENPYRGNKQAIKIGKAAYDGNCARCHGIDMISGGFNPDLRELKTSDDAFYISRVRAGVEGAAVGGMPAFEGILSQETMWAIRSYVDKRHYEYKDKDLSELYKQAAADEAAAPPSGQARAYNVANDDGGAEDKSAGAQNQNSVDKLDDINGAGQIEIAVYESFPPWSYKAEAGGFEGVDVDIAKALADKLGVSLNLTPFPPDESMGDDIRNMVWKGHYIGGEPADAMLHVGMAKPFQEANDQATFLGRYYNETMGFAYDADRFGEDIDSPLALAGNKLGVQLDTLGDFFLSSAYQGRLRNDVQHFDGVPQAMQALNQGEIAAVMAPLGELRGAAHRLEKKNVRISHVVLSGLYQNNWDVGLAIKAGNPALAGALEQAMTELLSSGRVESIFQDYGVPYRKPQGPDDSDDTTAAR